MQTLNLGILAHVDAGKTTLTERLLYAAGVIDKIGSVDDGSTQTDFLELERQRGITIKSAVVSFQVNDVTVNLIDTPGHPDFIAEVERVLGVLDCAVLVISAVEGVQAQTLVLMRTLQRLRIPTLLFVNKLDRAGAQYERTLHGIRERLTAAIVPMGTVKDIGSRSANFIPYAGAVDLVHEEQGWDAQPLQCAHQDTRLRLHSFDCGDQEHGAVEHAQHPFHLGDEIRVAGRVDQVDRDVIDDERHDGRLDRNAALAFQR